MAINIEQSGTSIAGYPVTVGLTPTSGGCSSTLASTYCQLTVALAPGNYTATLTTEDANNTPLSSGQSIAFTITAGANNVIPITLSGIPYALQVASGAAAVHGSAGAGFKLYGLGAQPVIVTALDADGNIIVGPGSPTYTANELIGSGWSAAAPSSTTPNTIAITPPGTNGSGATFSVSASYADSTCSQSGAVCTATFTIVNDVQTLFVANFNLSTVTAYTSPYTSAPTTISAGVISPQALALDGGGDLFVSNVNAETVTEYPPPYTAESASISVGEPGIALALNNGVDLLVSNGTANTVIAYPPPYNGNNASTLSSGLNDPSALALDSSGNLFVANEVNNTVTEYAPPYTGTPATTISSNVSDPWALTLDGAGDLFVANYLNFTVTEYVPPYTGTPAATITTSGRPYAIALDSAGNLFVANYFSNTVTEYTPPYTGLPTTTISNGVSAPRALAFDGAGNLFVANYSGPVTEYAPPYTGTPTMISNGVNGPDALLLTP
jgi:hypothetical protein